MSVVDLDSDLAAALVSEREVEHAAPRLLELPRSLPINALSNSSLTLLWKCPEKWRRRYLLREYEPSSGAAVLGSATGAAERRNFEQKILSGEDLSEADVLDAFADEWTSRAEDDQIDWKGEKPEKVRATGQAALALYHQTIAPLVKPATLERKFTLRFEGCDWTYVGYLDLEEQDGTVGDLKCKGRRLSQASADVDPQPSSYLLARRAEGTPAPGFDFHVMARTATPTAEVVATTRTDAQLDAFLARIFQAAREIVWRTEADVWSGAIPGEWWCSQKWCGFWSSCPYGGGAA